MSFKRKQSQTHPRWLPVNIANAMCVRFCSFLMAARPSAGAAPFTRNISCLSFFYTLAHFSAASSLFSVWLCCFCCCFRPFFAPIQFYCALSNCFGIEALSTRLFVGPAASLPCRHPHNPAAVLSTEPTKQPASQPVNWLSPQYCC